MIDFYAILGVSRAATAVEVRDAYLKLARDTHPDKVKDVEARKRAEDAFKNVTAAYDTLSRERSRREYTARLPATGETKPPAAPKAAPPMVKGPPLPPRGAAAGSSAAGSTKGQPTPAQAPAAPVRTEAIPGSGRVRFDALGQGIEAFKKQDYHSAVQLLNLAVEEEEDNAQAHGMLGLALGKNPNWVRDAVGHLETASRLDPKNVSYLVELALLLHSQGLKLRARRALDTAIAIDPNHADVARGLKDIPTEPAEPEAPGRGTPETGSGLFDRLRKR